MIFVSFLSACLLASDPPPSAPIGNLGRLAARHAIIHTWTLLLTACLPCRIRIHCWTSPLSLPNNHKQSYPQPYHPCRPRNQLTEAPLHPEQELKAEMIKK